MRGRGKRIGFVEGKLDKGNFVMTRVGQNTYNE